MQRKCNLLYDGVFIPALVALTLLIYNAQISTYKLGTSIHKKFKVPYLFTSTGISKTISMALSQTVLTKMSMSLLTHVVAFHQMYIF